MDARCRGWWTTQVALGGFGAAASVMFLADVVSISGTWSVVTASVLTLLTMAAMIVVPALRWARHRWEVTDIAVYSRSGLLWEEWRAAPLSRVQTVDKVRGPLQRLFGLSTVIVTTASSRGAVHISALQESVAADMVARLTLLTEDDQQDAT